MMELLPDDMDFIRLHHGLDMTPVEMARVLDVSCGDIVLAARCAEIRGPRLGQTLSAFCNPSFPRVATDVLKATFKDAYEPAHYSTLKRNRRCRLRVAP